MRINYYSLGCKVNLYETVSIVNKFIDAGYKEVSFDDESDLCIINTCTVTATSDAKSRKIIRQAVKRSPNAIVVVMGCYSQLNQQAVKDIAGVDIVVGTKNRDLVFDLVNDYLQEQICKVAKHEKNEPYEELKLDRYDHKTRGFVKIQDGCDNYCSYCAIPYSRGPIRSRKPENVIEEIKILTDNGMLEIVLSGINTGAYGKDFHDYNLSDLLRDVVKSVPNLGRIRISSVEATEISDVLLSVMSQNSAHFCNHLHIPLQGGNNNTLKRMNRKYDLLYYASKIAKIKEVFPLINITTDCLAGFSGETEDDFLDSMKFIETMNYGEMHVFPYSPRPNTAAFNLPGRVTEEEKHRRVKALLALNEKKAIEYRMLFKEKIVEVLVEKITDGVAFGHTSNYLEVEFNTTTAKPNSIVKVVLNEIGYPISRGSEYHE